MIIIIASFRLSLFMFILFLLFFWGGGGQVPIARMIFCCTIFDGASEDLAVTSTANSGSRE